MPQNVTIAADQGVPPGGDNLFHPLLAYHLNDYLRGVMMYLSVPNDGEVSA